MERVNFQVIEKKWQDFFSKEKLTLGNVPTGNPLSLAKRFVEKIRIRKQINLI